MSKNIFLAIVCIASITFGCKKTTDTAGPSITITSPTEGQMFMPVPDSILVTGTITDPDMHSYSIVAINATTGDTIFYQPETHEHDETVTINKKFKANYKTPVITSTAFVLEVSAEDHSENKSSKNVNFTAMP